MIKDYIKMFDTPEIQDTWIPKVGDKYCRYRKSGKTSIISHDRIERIIQRIDLYIFLPSIGQMAEMWHEAKSIEKQGWEFFYCVNEFLGKHHVGKAPEHIIALHFLMLSLYGLTWSEEKGEWVDG